MKTVRLLTILLALPLLAQADDSDNREYGFARQLMADGQEVFALLEYRRFVYRHPHHRLASAAQYEVAIITAATMGDMTAAKREFAKLTETYPRSAAAAKAKAWLADFEDAADEGDGKAFLLFTSAGRAAEAGSAQAAADQYEKLITDYPDSDLIAASLLGRGKLLLGPLKKPVAARETFKGILRRFPRGEQAPDAQYFYAVAVEKSMGPGPEAIKAYEYVAKSNPNADYVKKAKARLAELKDTKNVLTRHFRKRSVAPYTEKRKGYLKIGHEYVVQVECRTGLSSSQIKATLEDVLLRNYRNREKDTHRVQAEVYYNHPVTRVGKVEWSPGGEPKYTVKTSRNSDEVLKGVLIDIFR